MQSQYQGRNNTGLCMILYLVLFIFLECVTANSLSCRHKHGCFRNKRRVKAARSATVFIKTESAVPVNICPNRLPIVLTCHIHGFKSSPRINWYNGAMRVSNELYSLVKRVETKGGYSFISTYKFTDLPSEKSNKIACKASTSHQRASDQVELRWPPRNLPQFRNPLHKPVIGTLHINEGDIKTFSCLVKGGEPAVSNVNVKCYKYDERLAFNASKGSMTQFTLTGTEQLNSTVCICSAVHSTRCYSKMSFLQIHVHSVNKRLTGSGVEFPLPVIILTFSGSFFLLVVFCAAIGFCLTKTYRNRHLVESSKQASHFLNCLHIQQKMRNHKDKSIYESIISMNQIKPSPHVSLIQPYAWSNLIDAKQRLNIVTDTLPKRKLPQVNPFHTDEGGYLHPRGKATCLVPEQVTAFQRSRSAPLLILTDNGTNKATRKGLCEDVPSENKHDVIYITPI